jgi:hypothetical protein
MLAEVDVRTFRPQPVASSTDELLSQATSREPFAHSDGKSETPMERVVIDGEPYVVKHLHVDNDWIARAYGDLRCRPRAVWQSGILDALPPEIDHAVVGVATGEGRNGWGIALLMRDVSRWLVPANDAVLPLEQHRRFLDHMAALHAHFWGFEDTVGLTPLPHRWMPFGPGTIAAELERPDPPAVPRIAADGWSRFPTRAASFAGDTVLALRADPTPLLRALGTTPSTFVHGDWKAGNLGSHEDGRTILIDWQSPGEGPGASDLGWYLALNAARLPESKEDAIEAYRSALERRGIDTADWFERQLALCLLGMLVVFGWEKALGSDDEFGWWLARAQEGTRWLA